MPEEPGYHLKVFNRKSADEAVTTLPLVARLKTDWGREDSQEMMPRASLWALDFVSPRFQGSFARGGIMKRFHGRVKMLLDPWPLVVSPRLDPKF